MIFSLCGQHACHAGLRHASMSAYARMRISLIYLFNDIMFAGWVLLIFIGILLGLLRLFITPQCLFYLLIR